MEKVVVGVVFAVYMLLMIGIGVYFYIKKKNAQDSYLLAGRSLNPWVASMSAQASDMSGWLLTGLPGLAFLSILGAQEAIWTAIGLLIGTLLNWILVARRLRVYTQVAGDAQTMPEYFQNRFKDKKGILRGVSSIIILIFFTVYTASMFSASAKLFNSVFGMSYTGALVLGALIIVIYVFMGGFLAISYTDLVQGLLMFFCLLIIPFCILGKMDSTQLGDVQDLTGSIMHLFPSEGSDVGWMLIISSLGWGLGYCGMPHILVRFMATKDKRTIKPATIIASVWCILTLAAAVIIGIFAQVYLKDTQVADSEQVFIAVVQKLFNPFVSGIMLSAVLAAIMSTADSQLLVASTAFANDFYKLAIRKNASEKETIWVNRFTIIAVSILAVLIALDQNSSIFELVSYAWAGFGASFGPVVLFSLYSKRITKLGAVCSMITGALTTIIFKYGLSRLGGIWAIYELIPGFLFATIILWVVSLIDKKNAKPLEDDYEKMIVELKKDDNDSTMEESQKESVVVEDNNSQTNN